jgi:Family of unknown function (DUF6364)
MQAKLTLSLERGVIEQAKEVAREQHKSLSKMVENYLRLVSRKEAADDAISPVVARLMGVASLDVQDRGREEITAYLEEKHK